METGDLKLAERVIELAIQIQQIPAPTFGEGKRAEFVRGLFEREGLEDVFVDEVMAGPPQTTPDQCPGARRWRSRWGNE